MTRPGQIDLFTRRVRRGPEPTEFDIHVSVADLLRVAKMPGWIWWHVPNGGERVAVVGKDGKRRSIEGGRLQRMGTRAGVSDIHLVGPPHGRLHVLELKRRGQKPDEAQRAFMAAIEAAGGCAAWADNYGDAVAVLIAWGALRKTV